MKSKLGIVNFYKSIFTKVVYSLDFINIQVVFSFENHKGNILPNPILAAVGNWFRSRMSFWNVGNVEAPPKENRMAPKERKKWRTDGAGYSTCSGALSAINKAANNRIQAVTVVTRAMIAAGL